MLHPFFPEDDDGHSHENYQWVQPHHLTPHQVRLREELQRLRPLGLRLDVSSLFPREEESDLDRNVVGLAPQMEKVKAASVPARILKIGSWQRVTKNPSDLVAKWYFAKRKLVWEILEGTLKSKIEVQWFDIIAINAYIRPNEPGVLQVELNRSPTFHEETDPQPRKHTIWKPASDFTGGQASTCRRHVIIFPPGELDKPYEKLLQYDQRLMLLSQRPFPSLQNPHFPTFDGASEFCLGYHPPMANPSPISVMQFSHSDNNGATMWDEQVNSNEVGYNNSGLYPALVTARNYDISGGIDSNPYSSTASYQHQIGSQQNSYVLSQRLKALESMGVPEQDIATEFYDRQQHQQQVFVPNHTDVELYQQQHHPGRFGYPYPDGVFNHGMEHFDRHQ